MPYQTFTSESVCAGHPDKICDQISDAIVDAVLAQDPAGRVGAETAVCENRVILLGEITSRAQVDFEAIARHEISRLGYTDPALGFSQEAQVEVHIGTQSPEIARGVIADGAGDQGMMFGYACRETSDFMPLPITIAHELTRAIDRARQSQALPYLLPDGKSQITVNYDRDLPVSIAHVTIAAPHESRIPLGQVTGDLYDHIIAPILGRYDMTVARSDVVVNGTGVWHQPGPKSDAGLTGRKIVADSYGGYARVGGGAFSGKDPTKVDRSGAYAARYLAKNIVAAGLADKAEVSLCYFIGAQQPVATGIETFGTEAADPRTIRAFADQLLDTSVHGIITGLKLDRPIYRSTAAYGHFGDPSYPWEQISPAS